MLLDMIQLWFAPELSGRLLVRIMWFSRRLLNFLLFCKILAGVCLLHRFFSRSTCSLNTSDILETLFCTLNMSGACCSSESFKLRQRNHRQDRTPVFFSNCPRIFASFAHTMYKLKSFFECYFLLSFLLPNPWFWGWKNNA